MNKFEEIAKKYDILAGGVSIDNNIDKASIDCCIEGKMSGLLTFTDEKMFELFLCTMQALVSVAETPSSVDVKQFTKILKIASKFGLENLKQEDLNKVIFAAAIIENLSSK